MTPPRTNWELRRQELRRQHGLERWDQDPPRLIAEIEAEKREEEAYLASLPQKEKRPTSARSRKAARNAAQAAKKGPKKGRSKK